MWLWLCQDDESDGSHNSDEDEDDEVMEEEEDDDDDDDEEEEEEEVEQAEVDQNFRLELMKVLQQQNALVGFQKWSPL